MQKEPTINIIVSSARLFVQNARNLCSGSLYCDPT